jgi:molecular chaperone DnaK (HSP70)
MKSAVDVDDADVQKMVEESVENAFDDLKARQWIEEKIKAGTNMTATRKTMADFAADLDPEYKKQIEEVLSEIERVLETEEPRTKTGDPRKLKEANAKLDEITKPLADFAMDKAMEAILRKRGLLPPEDTEK